MLRELCGLRGFGLRIRMGVQREGVEPSVPELQRTSGDCMLKHPFLLVFVCLALLITAYDASAKVRQSDTAEKSATSKKANKSQFDGAPQKAAPKASGKSSTSGSVKKPSQKQKTQVSAKPQAKPQAKAQRKAPQSQKSNSRKPQKISRDPSTLPHVNKQFSATPQSVLTVLSSIPVDGNISSSFGQRRLGRAKHARMHTGVDISAQRGTPVVAAASGVVCFVGHWAAYGKIVEIDHGNGLITRYAHLDKYTVKIGDRVYSGEQIGNVGRTGRTTGAHLHFETLVNGRVVNPMIAEMWRQTPAQLAAKREMYAALPHLLRAVFEKDEVYPVCPRVRFAAAMSS